MKIKLKEFEVDSENPFKYDTLNRQENAEILTQFVSSIDEPYVIALNSEWGTGKTTFLRMWQRYLERQNFNVIYFNAWENDFNDDPLIPLINEIGNSISCGDESDKMKKAKEYLAQIKPLAFNLIKRAVPQAIKLSTAGLVDAPKIIEDSIAAISEELAKDKFEEYEKKKKSFLDFKNTIQKFSKAVGRGKPIIFMIDELDRCRPNYAIELLEKVKHLFCTNGIIFILGVDKKQLGRSASVLYGNIDVDGYLSRLIDIDYVLPRPDIKLFVKNTLEKHGLSDFFKNRDKYSELKFDYRDSLEVFSGLFLRFNFSLRQIEQTLSQFVIVARLSKENDYFYPQILCLLLILRRKDLDQYKKIISKRFNVDLVMKKLGLERFLDKQDIDLIIAHFELHLKQENGTNERQPFFDELGMNREDSPTIRAVRSQSTYGGIGFLSEKIEIAKRFEHT